MIFCFFIHFKRKSISSKFIIFRRLRIFKTLRMFLYFTNHSTTAFSTSTSNRMTDRGFVLIFSVAAELSFEHVEQPDSIQSSGWTRISIQLSGLNKIFCSNPRNLYVTSSVSSGSSCSTQGLSWRVCSTRGSGLNFCSKLNSTIRLLILWRWSCFHQSRNHFFDDVWRRWARFSLTIALKTISLVDRISCFSNDRIKSSRAFISWFCNILLCFSFFASESRLMKALKNLAFTLNILAATALLSVKFSFKNFFAFFISTMMMIKMKFILTRKRSLFWFEKKIDNQSENQIIAIITITNEISEDLCRRIFMRWGYESISVK